MRRGLAAALLGVALLGCRAEPDAAPTGANRQAQATAQAGKPELALLTGLPLVFGESFTLETTRSPVLAGLEEHYRVRLVDGPEQLEPGELLLAAQPRALTAERLVQLDEWVRGGGRLLLLADPRLTWPSDLPLGDRQRPPYSFADTGLLAHWGLTLEAPAPGTSARVTFTLGGRAVASDSPGRLTSSGRDCRVAVDGRSAQCRLGKGWGRVVADADFLREAGGPEAVTAALEQLGR